MWFLSPLGLVATMGVSFSAVQAAVGAAARVASEHGILVGTAEIPNPREELFREFI